MIVPSRPPFSLGLSQPHLMTLLTNGITAAETLEDTFGISNLSNPHSTIWYTYTHIWISIYRYIYLCNYIYIWYTYSCMIYTWLTLGVSSGIWKRHGWSGSHSHTWQRPSRTSVENIGLSLTSHLFGYFLAVFAVDFEVTKIRFLQPCMLCMTHHFLLLPIIGFRTMEAGCDVAPTPFHRLAGKKTPAQRGTFLDHPSPYSHG